MINAHCDKCGGRWLPRCPGEDAGPCPWCESRELRAIVDKLPKTADGVPMVPGMEVWCIGTMRYNNGAMEELSGRTKEHVLMGLQRGKLFEGRLYSTREAAEKAREG